MPITFPAPDAEAMRVLGRSLASYLAAGDVIIASGDLGAGKTTFTQGLGEGLGVQGSVTSPTFVISRIHRNPGSGTALVHVDAYRLHDSAELEDLDLEETLADSVTLVEWGEGKAEVLSDNVLHIIITRSTDPADDTRHVSFTGYGSRWQGVNFDQLGAGA